MAKQVINVGAIINDGTGDAIRSGAQKINDNFNEIYTALGASDGSNPALVSSIVPGTGLITSSRSGDVQITAKLASEIEFGVVKVGNGITVNNGVISGQSYVLPNAATNILGGIKVGTNLSITNDGVLSANPGGYTLPKATPIVLGGVTVGSGLNVYDGEISAIPYTLPTATGSVIGGVKIGNNINISNGTISVATPFSGAYIDLTGLPDLKTVATTGAYSDLTGRPTIPSAQIQSDWTQSNNLALDHIKNKPTIPAAQIQSNWTQADSGSLDFIKNKPAIPVAQIQSDWSENNNVSLAFIKNKPSIFSGNYNDLYNRPDVPAAYSATSINALSDVDTTSIAPSSGQALVWNSGISQWVPGSVASGGGGGAGLVSRNLSSATTASLANNAAGNITIAGWKGYMLLSIQTSAAAWITVYASSAARTADASRTITTDPVPGSGVLAEIITTGPQTQLFSPAVLGFSDEVSPSTDIQIKVVNRSGSTGTITVTMKLVQLEV